MSTTFSKLAGRAFQRLFRRGTQFWATLNGAVLFYTRVPLPQSWPAEFKNIALIAPLIGIALGVLLCGLDWLFFKLEVPGLLSSALLVLMGVWLTGGLHMDGAMDTADGLAVQDARQRLTVMADSRAGAFGVMIAIAIILLKIFALETIVQHRWFALTAAAAWGRWGQQWAIGNYPYLKSQGKGAFHKKAVPSFWQTLPAAMGLMGITALMMVLGLLDVRYGLMSLCLGISSSVMLSAWLAHKLGGHTGDTYGAVVEWVEVAMLVGLTAVH
ncbi:MAG: adenosylcobinamide-GDP ribazoletransferase [Cyanobacteria bacterium P01_D01_bin.156]